MLQLTHFLLGNIFDVEELCILAQFVGDYVLLTKVALVYKANLHSSACWIAVVLTDSYYLLFGPNSR